MEETIHDGGICSSRLQVTVVDVEVLDLDAHEDLVLQFGNVGVADVEVSDVALLLNHTKFIETLAGFVSFPSPDRANQRTFLSSSQTTLSLNALILLQSTSRPRGFFSQAQ